MKREILAIALCLMSLNASASDEFYDCRGESANGTDNHIVISFKNDKMIVNQDTYNIEIYFEHGKGLATVNFVTTKGHYAYNAIRMYGKKLMFKQHNAATNEIIAQFPIKCKRIEE